MQETIAAAGQKTVSVRIVEIETSALSVCDRPTTSVGAVIPNKCSTFVIRGYCHTVGKLAHVFRDWHSEETEKLSWVKKQAAGDLRRCPTCRHVCEVKRVLRLRVVDLAGRIFSERHSKRPARSAPAA